MLIWAGLADAPRSPSIQRVELATGAHRPLISASEAAPLVAPNDLVFDAHGGFYFTDTRAPAEGREPGAIYYAKADGTGVRRLADAPGANGIVVAADRRRLLVAGPLRVLAFDIVGPGELARDGAGKAIASIFCSAQSGRFDSMAAEAGGGLVVGTLMIGGLSVFTERGALRETVLAPPERSVTSVGFGGPERRTAFATLTQTGKLCAVDWPRPGLRLQYSAVGR